MLKSNPANSSGHTLESAIISTFTSKKFTVVSYCKYIKDPEKYGKELLLKNIPFTTIYMHRGQTEFLVKSDKYQLEIRIECKWQQSSGSVDEKFPYLYLNCIEKMPEEKIFIIVDGSGAKQGSLNWLKQACQTKLYTNETNNKKEIVVMNLAEFLIWANKTLR